MCLSHSSEVQACLCARTWQACVSSTAATPRHHKNYRPPRKKWKTKHFSAAPSSPCIQCFRPAVFREISNIRLKYSCVSNVRLLFILHSSYIHLKSQSYIHLSRNGHIKYSQSWNLKCSQEVVSEPHRKTAMSIRIASSFKNLFSEVSVCFQDFLSAVYSQKCVSRIVIPKECFQECVSRRVFPKECFQKSISKRLFQKCFPKVCFQKCVSSSMLQEMCSQKCIWRQELMYQDICIKTFRFKKHSVLLKNSSFQEIVLIILFQELFFKNMCSELCSVWAVLSKRRVLGSSKKTFTSVAQIILQPLSNHDNESNIYSVFRTTFWLRHLWSGCTISWRDCLFCKTQPVA